MRWRLVKFLLLLGVLVAAGLVVFAYLGDLAPPPSEQSLTVTLDVN